MKLLKREDEFVSAKKKFVKPMIIELEKSMGKYFEMVKKDVQIEEVLESSDTEDESSNALKRLRPP